MNGLNERRAIKLAEARLRARRERIAARLAEALPRDVAVAADEAGVSLSGRRLGLRFVRDPGFAVLREGAGRLA